jgi:hypothetical protein
VQEELFERDQVSEPIERMFEREYPSELGLFQVVEEETDGGSGFAHFAYVEGLKRRLHVVRMEESYKDCITNVNAGVHTLGRIDANCRWLALPLHEFRDGDEELNGLLESVCSSRGIGIITVQQKGLGVSAKVVLKAEPQEGRFVKHYERLNEDLRSERNELVGVARGGYKVVQDALTS